MLEIAGINPPEGSVNLVDAQFLRTALGELFLRLIHLLPFYLVSNELYVCSFSNSAARCDGWKFFWLKSIGRWKEGKIVDSVDVHNFWRATLLT